MNLTIPTPPGSRKENFRRLNLCIALGLASVAGQAAAQLEEVIVTAQKKSESLQEVPVAVSVVSGDSVTNDAIVDMTALSAKIPTVKLASSVVAELINIRGFGSGNNAAFEQSVATFVDGAYRGRAVSSSFAFLDMAQLEALKGPQTVYFGANATAGAFNITTKRAHPGDDAQANISTYYEPEYNDYILEGGVSVPLSDTLAARVALKANGGDGYSKNRAQDRDETDREDVSGRLSLAWEPTDTYRMDVRLDYGETDQISAEGELYSCGNFKFGYQSPDPLALCNRYIAEVGIENIDDKLDWKTDGGGAAAAFEAEFYEFGLTNRWELESGTLTAVTSYYDHESARLTSPAPYPLTNNLGEPGAFFPADTREEYKQFTQELRFETSLNDSIDLTVGAYYLDGELQFDQYQALLFVAPPLLGLGAQPYNGIGTHFDINVEEMTYSVFSAVDLQITDSIALNLGVRYTDVEKTGVGNNDAGLYSSGLTDLATTYTPFSVAEMDAAFLNAGVVPPDFANPEVSVAQFMSVNYLGYPDSDYDDSAVQPSIGITWHIGFETMVYAKYNEGFKSGGFGFNGPLDVFDAEDVSAYEVGLKTGLLDGAMELSVAAFLNNYDDLQEAGNRTNIFGGVETYIENVGSVEASGLELGLRWQATDSLYLGLDIAYLDSVYDSYPDATCDEITKESTGVQVCDLSGETRPFAPEVSGSLNATYVLPIGEGEITIQPSIDFTSGYDTLATLDPVGYQESYEKVNLRLAYGPNDGSWTLALIGKNLTDEYTSDFRNISPSSPGSAVVWSNPPRTVGVQFNWNYE